MEPPSPAVTLHLTDFWTVIGAVLVGNAITIVCVYLFVSYRQGKSIGQTSARALNGILTLGWQGLRIYVALIVIAVFVYAAKLIIFDGALLH